MVDPCCFDYLKQFEWHLMEDGRAARTETCPCYGEPGEHEMLLIYMDEEVIERHLCDFENGAGFGGEE
jgi:hypothetical protein